MKQELYLIDEECVDLTYYTYFTSRFRPQNIILRRRDFLSI